MSVPLPASARPPVTSIAGAIARMEQINQELPAADGLACFNRMYLEVTLEVGHRIAAGFFANPLFMTRLDVVFANLYLDAAGAAERPEAVPLAWRPLIEQRRTPGIEEIQFALAGMNAHINHDLPIAVVRTAAELGTAPTAGSHHADYQKVDQLLDNIERSVRQSFETQAELDADRHLTAVCNLIANWSIGSARDLAWHNCRLLWKVKDDPLGYELVCGSLAASTAMASRLLLVPV
jgi:Family of unknown function (DUF5995)